MDVKESDTFRTSKIWEGEIYGKNVVLAKCGVGQEKAQICTRFLIDHYDLEAIIFSGIGGATHSGIDMGDIVVASDVLYLNFDSLSFEIYRTDEALASLAMNCAGGLDIHRGRFYTTTPIMVDEFLLYLYLKIKNVKCVEMENAPMAKLAMESDIPFVSIRGISDQVGPLMFFQVQKYAQLAADNAAQVTLEMINRWE